MGLFMHTVKRFSFPLATVVIVFLSWCLYHKGHPVRGQVTQTGPMPSLSFLFDSTGAALGPVYCTQLKGNSTTSGTFSFTGTGPLINGTAAWTNPGGAWIVNDGIFSAGTAVASAYTPYYSTFTIVSNAITLSGTVKSPTTLVVLGATAVPATVAEPMAFEVCAN